MQLCIAHAYYATSLSTGQDNDTVAKPRAAHRLPMAFTVPIISLSIDNDDGEIHQYNSISGNKKNNYYSYPDANLATRVNNFNFFVNIFQKYSCAKSAYAYVSVIIVSPFTKLNRVLYRTIYGNGGIDTDCYASRGVNTVLFLT